MSRPVLKFDEWFEKYFDKDGPDTELTKAFLIVLSSEYSVHPTQILPSDRFDKELRPASWWSARGHEKDLFEMWVDEATRGNDQLTNDVCISVRDLLVRIDQIRSKLPDVEDDKDETFTLPKSLKQASYLYD